MARDARDWEACALVPWAMHLPPHCGARDIERLVSDELHLQAGDLHVTLHQPEPYLLRFTHPHHAAAAEIRGRFQGRGIDICLWRWRSLSHALGLRLFYRVKLCLDGIPPHAWTPDIIERVIGHRCALQFIVTDLVQSAETRHIEIWAWTLDPSNIPKKVWLCFTHRPIDGSSAVFVSTEEPPDVWHQAVRFEVFLHMPILEDFTGVKQDLQAAINNPAAVAPVRRRFDWRYGLVDGAPTTARSPYPARLPRPPQGWSDRANAGRASGADGREVRRDGRGAQDLRDDRDMREGLSHRYNGRPGMNGEAGRHEKNDRSRGNRGSNSRRSDGRERVGGRTSCKGFINDRTRRRDDDNDDSDNYGGDNERRGLGNLTGASFWGFDEEGPVRRERTRSPPRRDYTHRGHVIAPAALHRQFAEALQRNTPTVDPTADALDFISRDQRLLDRVGQNAAGNDA
jgi:hypothetical protein